MKLLGSTNTRTFPSSNDSTLSSARGSASDHSNRYEKPVQPPPRIPTRRPLGGTARCAAALLISATARSVTAMAMIVASPPASGAPRRPLGLVIGDGALDGVLGQDRAVDLHRRQVQLLDDLGVLDAHRLIDGHPLDPLCRQ